MGIQIPTYDSNKVRAVGVPNTPQVQAPDGLGALASSLRETSNILKASQDHADKVRVDGADAEAMAVWSAAKLKISALEGDAALNKDTIKAINDEAEAQVKAIGGKLSTDSQREMFNQLTMRRRNTYNDFAGEHQLKQFKVVKKTNADARETAVINDGRTSAENLHAVGIASARAELQDAVAANLEANGFTDPKSDVYKAAQLRATSRFHAGVVEGFLASKEPGKTVLAKEYLTATREEIDGKVYDMLTKRLEGEGAAYDGLKAYEEAVAAHPDDVVAQQKFLREKVRSGGLDEKAYTHAQGEMDRSAHLRKQQLAQVQNEYESKVWDALNKYGIDFALNCKALQDYAAAPDMAEPAGKLRLALLRDQREQQNEPLNLADRMARGIQLYRLITEGFEGKPLDKLSDDELKRASVGLGKEFAQHLVDYWGRGRIQESTEREFKVTMQEAEGAAMVAWGRPPDHKLTDGEKATITHLLPEIVKLGTYKGKKMDPAERQAHMVQMFKKVKNGKSSLLFFSEEKPLVEVLRDIPPRYKVDHERHLPGSTPEQLAADWAEDVKAGLVDENTGLRKAAPKPTAPSNRGITKLESR